MVTEHKSIMVDTVLDDKMQKEMSRSAHKLSLVLIIVGAIGVAAFTAFQIISFFTDLEDDGFYFILIVFAIFLGLGFYLSFVLGKAEEKMRSSNRVSSYEFFRDFFTLSETVNGETVANAKVYNNQIAKVRETKNYLFLHINGNSAYPVAKEKLTKEELNTIKAAFAVKTEGGVLNLSDGPETQTAPEAQTVPAPQTTPETQDGHAPSTTER